MADIVSFTKVDGAGGVVTYTITNATPISWLLMLANLPGNIVS